MSRIRTACGFLAAAAIVALALPAQAALVSTDCLQDLDTDTSMMAPDASPRSVTPLQGTCLASTSVGGPYGSFGGAAAGEVIDLDTDVVYVFQNGYAEPVGGAIPAIGYVQIDTQWDNGPCYSSSPLGCMPHECQPMTQCVWWMVHVTGCHDVTVIVQVSDLAPGPVWEQTGCGAGSSLPSLAGVNAGKTSPAGLLYSLTNTNNYATNMPAVGSTQTMVEWTDYEPGVRCASPGVWTFYATLVVDGSPLPPSQAGGPYITCP